MCVCVCVIQETHYYSKDTPNKHSVHQIKWVPSAPPPQSTSTLLDPYQFDPILR